MVTIFPNSLADLEKRRPETPQSEKTVYKQFLCLPDEWHVWHSIRWHNNTEAQSGECDFLIFHENYGFLVAEVKGGIISNQGGIFYSENTKTGKKYKLTRDPFHQAERFMWYILEFYKKKAKNHKKPIDYLKYSHVQNRFFFPLNFDHFVFFPDSNFKENIETVQYRYNQVFDKGNVKDHNDWGKNNEKDISPLEAFLIKLLNIHEDKRVLKPKTKELFCKLIGSNISSLINLKTYYKVRNEELRNINQVQDYLLNALSKKKKAIFRGSAGSGKTFIAMKKAMLNYDQGKKTLFLCFNKELRENVKSHISKELDVPIWKLEDNLDIFSINLFLIQLIQRTMHQEEIIELKEDLYHFEYSQVADKIRQYRKKIPDRFIYDSIIIDEAQDFDQSLWNIFTYFLRERENSEYYIFYDGSQTIFRERFSLAQFNFEKNSDLIVLNRNLRNSREIVQWIEKRVKLGEYSHYSGINGFNVTKHRFKSSNKALFRILKTILGKYLSKQMDFNDFIILSYYKLENLLDNIRKNDFGHYVKFKLKKKTFLIEPYELSHLPRIKKKFGKGRIIPFKTITAFKGLERDIVFLILPTRKSFKKAHPERFENFRRQLYVGASRAKFKLYIAFYDLRG